MEWQRTQVDQFVNRSRDAINQLAGQSHLKPAEIQPIIQSLEEIFQHGIKLGITKKKVIKKVPINNHAGLNTLKPRLLKTSESKFFHLIIKKKLLKDFIGCVIDYFKTTKGKSDYHTLYLEKSIIGALLVDEPLYLKVHHIAHQLDVILPQKWKRESQSSKTKSDKKKRRRKKHTNEKSGKDTESVGTPIESSLDSTPMKSIDDNQFEGHPDAIIANGNQNDMHTENQNETTGSYSPKTDENVFDTCYETVASKDNDVSHNNKSTIKVHSPDIKNNTKVTEDSNVHQDVNHQESLSITKELPTNDSKDQQETIHSNEDDNEVGEHTVHETNIQSNNQETVTLENTSLEENNNEEQIMQAKQELTEIIEQPTVDQETNGEIQDAIDSPNDLNLVANQKKDNSPIRLPNEVQEDAQNIRQKKTIGDTIENEMNNAKKVDIHLELSKDQFTNGNQQMFIEKENMDNLVVIGDSKNKPVDDEKSQDQLLLDMGKLVGKEIPVDVEPVVESNDTSVDDAFVEEDTTENEDETISRNEVIEEEVNNEEINDEIIEEINEEINEEIIEREKAIGNAKHEEFEDEKIVNEYKSEQPGETEQEDPEDVDHTEPEEVENTEPEEEIVENNSELEQIPIKESIEILEIDKTSDIKMEFLFDKKSFRIQFLYDGVKINSPSSPTVNKENYTSGEPTETIEKPIQHEHPVDEHPVQQENNEVQRFSAEDEKNIIKVDEKPSDESIKTDSEEDQTKNALDISIQPINHSVEEHLDSDMETKDKEVEECLEDFSEVEEEPVPIELGFDLPILKSPPTFSKHKEEVKTPEQQQYKDIQEIEYQSDQSDDEDEKSSIASIESPSESKPNKPYIIGQSVDDQQIKVKGLFYHATELPKDKPEPCSHRRPTYRVKPQQQFKVKPLFLQSSSLLELDPERLHNLLKRAFYCDIQDTFENPQLEAINTNLLTKDDINEKFFPAIEKMNAEHMQLVLQHGETTSCYSEESESTWQSVKSSPNMSDFSSVSQAHYRKQSSTITVDSPYTSISNLSQSSLQGVEIVANYINDDWDQEAETNLMELDHIKMHFKLGLDKAPSKTEYINRQHNICPGCGRNLIVRKRLFQRFQRKPRYCFYTDKYYCTTCHSNKEFHIPGRIVYKWDFVQKPVCNQVYEYFKRNRNTGNICISAINPTLFDQVKTLAQARRRKHRISLLWDTISKCKRKNIVLQSLKLRKEWLYHYIEQPEIYSLSNLLSLAHGSKNIHMTNLRRILRTFKEHVEKTCTHCQEIAGSICARCNQPKLLFRHDMQHVKYCPMCKNLYHWTDDNRCFIRSDGQMGCPQCEEQQ